MDGDKSGEDRDDGHPRNSMANFHRDRRGIFDQRFIKNEEGNEYTAERADIRRFHDIDTDTEAGEGQTRPKNHHRRFVIVGEDESHGKEIETKGDLVGSNAPTGAGEELGIQHDCQSAKGCGEGRKFQFPKERPTAEAENKEGDQRIKFGKNHGRQEQ